MPGLSPIRDAIGWLMPLDCMTPGFMRQAMLGLLLLSPITALMGTQVVNMRMAFFADAISHSAFAGVAVGLLLAVDPRWSTLAFALAVGLGVTATRRRSSLSGDSIIGVFFSGAVAFGLAVVSRDRNAARNVQSLLYGDILTLGDGETWALFGLLAVVLAFQLYAGNRLVYAGVDPAVAEAHQAGCGLEQYMFAAILSRTAIFAVWTVGVLLVTALLVVPAAAARNLASSMGGMFRWALAISLLSSVAGLLISAQPWAGTATGATVVLCSFLCFLISVALAAKRKRTVR